MSIEILDRSPEEVAGVGTVLTDNIARIMPLYDIHTHLQKSGVTTLGMAN